MKLYNYMIYLDALNKYTKHKWTYCFKHDIYYCDLYEVVETDNMGLYELNEFFEQSDTGIIDDFLIVQYESFADIIDIINERDL